MNIALPSRDVSRYDQYERSPPSPNINLPSPNLGMPVSMLGNNVASSSSSRLPKVVGKNYIVANKIGSGSFGVIYGGRDAKSGGEVAIKFESARTKHPQLSYEARLYKVLNKEPVMGIPRVRWFGLEEDYNVMVMDCLGPTLEDLFGFCSRRFSLKTVLMIADQLISRVQFLHSMQFIHRDIKPENFLMGRSRCGHHIYMVDFGLAKKYIDDTTGRHIKYRKNKSLTGTARYTSVNSHMGIEQSRRDDMESLGYLFVYFFKGLLPWQGLTATNRTKKYEKIHERKMNTPIETLCRNLPIEFTQYFQHIKNLQFEEVPDYDMLRKSFRDLFNREGYCMDFVYDWTMLRKDSNNHSFKSSQNNNSPSTDHMGDV
ncbi:casein kinase [Acrasis kona]|uniref:non-specific serine/threonine protein kinase n=1 Tax=Acrasis kona TaxID=1008807 RepID=A0AAW2ZFF5_9EUKA